MNDVYKPKGEKGPFNEMKRISISDGNTKLCASLNDTVAAKDFIKRLPCNFSGFDSGVDYCCSAADGEFDPEETQTGWKNGDLSLGGGYFAVLCGGEEQSSSYRNMMIIGHLDDDSIELVKKMPGRVNFQVELIDDQEV